jgi:hypothetical protein
MPHWKHTSAAVWKIERRKHQGKFGDPSKAFYSILVSAYRYNAQGKAVAVATVADCGSMTQGALETARKLCEAHNK